MVETQQAEGESAVFWRGMAVILTGVALFNGVDIFTVLDDRPDLHPIEPVIWNVTSLIAFAPAAWVIWRAYRLAPPGQVSLRRLLVTHAVGALIMAAVHVPLFTLLRQAAYRLMGAHYGFGPIAEFPYEFRKDLLGYVLGVAIYWTIGRLSRPTPAPQTAPELATFDIRDRGRVVRVDLDQILAVTSAGNYVEFILADGRRPLMRAALAGMEAELSSKGFVRTHRSWLVNAARVSELRPESSGDYRVRGGDVEAPVSRRFPLAIARLKAGQSLARST